MSGRGIAIAFLLLYASLFSAKGQQELTLFHRPDIQSSSTTNPAFFGTERFRFTVPSAAFNYGNTGFSYNDLIRPDPGSDSMLLDMEGMIEGLRPKETLYLELDVRYFQFGHRNGPHFFGLSAADRSSVYVRYPKELAELAWYGNERFIGETVDIGVEASALKYRELTLHYGYEHEGARFGLNAKYLQGLAAFDTPEHLLELTTDTGTYDLTARTDYTVRTASMKNFGKLLPPFRIDDPDRGVGFDLGFDIPLSDRFDLSGSVLDLGYIQWREETNVQRSNGSYTFTGIDLQRFMDEDSLSFDHYLDSLEREFAFEESGESFRTPLVPKMNLGARFHPDSIQTIGLSMYGLFLDGFRPAFTASYQRLFEEPFGLGLDLRTGVSYSYKNRSFRNFGLSFSARYGAVKFFVVGDNLLSWFLPRAEIPLAELHPVFPDPDSDRSLAVPRHMKNHNFRVGLSFGFGKE